MQKKIMIFLVGVMQVCCANNSNSNNLVASDTPPSSHKNWDSFVSTYVNEDGLVNYEAILRNKQKLESYLTRLENAHPNNSWSEAQKKAYWINAYNAFTVKLIIDHYPVESIKDIGGVQKSPWKIAFINIEGHTYTLGNIEHEILRKEFDDPRIHFAINCASISCPKLINEAYTADNLKKQLTTVTNNFINKSGKNKIKPDKITISKIFKWYEEDFTKNGTIIDYLNKYSTTQIRQDAEIDYKGYDWNLNGK